MRLALHHLYTIIYHYLPLFHDGDAVAATYWTRPMDDRQGPAQAELAIIFDCSFLLDARHSDEANSFATGGSLSPVYLVEEHPTVAEGGRWRFRGRDNDSAQYHKNRTLPGLRRPTGQPMDNQDSASIWSKNNQDFLR